MRHQETKTNKTTKYFFSRDVGTEKQRRNPRLHPHGPTRLQGQLYPDAWGVRMGGDRPVPGGPEPQQGPMDPRDPRPLPPSSLAERIGFKTSRGPGSRSGWRLQFYWVSSPWGVRKGDKIHEGEGIAVETQTMLQRSYLQGLTSQCRGLPSKSTCGSPRPVPHVVTLFGNRVIADVIG